jgi:hypothetical protein
VFERTGNFDMFDKDDSFDYLPNELKFNTKYQNESVEMILNGANNLNRSMLIDFFRGLTLCH